MIDDCCDDCCPRQPEEGSGYCCSECAAHHFGVDVEQRHTDECDGRTVTLTQRDRYSLADVLLTAAEAVGRGGSQPPPSLREQTPPLHPEGSKTTQLRGDLMTHDPEGTT